MVALNSSFCHENRLLIANGLVQASICIQYQLIHHFPVNLLTQLSAVNVEAFHGDSFM